MFTKQFLIVHWTNFPLTMCYETEKNKRESIEPVVMYNLQGLHLAANTAFCLFFCFFFFLPSLPPCELHSSILDNLVGGKWLFYLFIFFCKILAAGQRQRQLNIWRLCGCARFTVSSKQDAWMCTSHFLFLMCHVTPALAEPSRTT